MENDDDLLAKIIFNDETTFHLSGKVNRYNVRIWGSENPHATLEVERDSPKPNVFCAESKQAVYGPFIFEGQTVYWPKVPGNGNQLDDSTTSC